MSNIFKYKKTPDPKVNEAWVFSETNYYIFIIGLIMIILGYIIMAKGEVYSNQSLVIAPLLLFIGYIIFVPLALLYKKKKIN